MNSRIDASPPSGGNASGCTHGPASLAAALSITATPTVAGGHSSGAVSLSAGTQTVATGPALLTSPVNVSYSQVVGVTEALQGNCSYAVTVTYTVS